MSRWKLTVAVLAVLAALAGLAWLSAPARAQQLCAPLPDLLKALKDRHGEWIVFVAEAPAGRYYLTRSDDGRWSLVIAREDVGCLVLAGRESEFVRGY